MLINKDNTTYDGKVVLRESKSVIHSMMKVLTELRVISLLNTLPIILSTDRQDSRTGSTEQKCSIHSATSEDIYSDTLRLALLIIPMPNDSISKSNWTVKVIGLLACWTAKRIIQ